MQVHGGRLGEAVLRYGRPREKWLDLSTGINAHSWPVPAIPTESWQRLPETDDGLEAAAKAYYGCETLLPVAGSQAAIQLLPKLRAISRVAIIDPGYNEHRAAWINAGHQVSAVSPDGIDAIIDAIDVLVVINPNNPGAQHYSPEQLLQWHQQLSQRGGWLVVDEAFIDTTPELSLATQALRSNLILLRSVGKFFGLAGMRCGFVIAEQQLLTRLEQQLGPWTLSGPSRFACQHALADRQWQQRMREYLPNQSERLQHMLHDSLKMEAKGTALFQTLHCPQAEQYHHALAEQGVLTRLFPEPQLLRFGVPADEEQWQQLQRALKTLV